MDVLLTGLRKYLPLAGSGAGVGEVGFITVFSKYILPTDPFLSHMYNPLESISLIYNLMDTVLEIFTLCLVSIILVFQPKLMDEFQSHILLLINTIKYALSRN